MAEQEQDYLTKLDAQERDDDKLDGYFGVVDNDDVFQGDPEAPEWVREWHGPFTIRIRRTGTTCPACGYPLEADGTCSYADMDETENVDHLTGAERE
jgi:hypothetical protein